MVSLNSPCRMVKFFMGSFSIAILAFTLAICEAKHLKIVSQTSLNPKPYHDYSINTHEFGTKNNNDFFLPRYNISIQDSLSAVFRSSKVFDKNGPLSLVTDSLEIKMQSAIASCRELMSLASYNLNLSLPTHASASTGETLVDIKTNLCSTMAYIETCLDVFKYAPERARNMVTTSLSSSIKNISNSLSILSTVDEHDPNLGSLANDGRKPRNAWPPSWMSFEEREILLDSIKEKANVKVAQDGSGRFKTISEAINIAPRKSSSRFVIYVKHGKYYENVKIDESKWNIVLVGDGMDKTVISGKLSNSAGQSIHESATLGVHGKGFIATKMGFENTAGPTGHQAVALLSSSDKSIFYQCSMSGYQDIVFAATGRQFYRECRISGTIDFIFGFSSAVFQRCTILVRKPLHGQDNTITAQGKSNPRCPSGFSIQSSTIKAAEDLGRARTFLGRPWRKYATVVFMESNLGGIIDGVGWSGPKGNGDPLPNTVYYGEYMNKGSDPKGRGRANTMSAAEAQGFTVTALIGGNQWLRETGVPYQSNL